ncbi:MAG: polyphosphate kinase 2 family protein [Deinococcales bacterium]
MSKGFEQIDTSKYLVSGKFSLKDIDPNDAGPYEYDSADKDAKREAKDRAEDDHKKLNKRLAELQNVLYADGSKALLVVFQALDAGGKDSSIRHVFSGINPQGVQVTSFKQPSKEELSHDYLWRVHKVVPPKGMIGIFNRSHYEEVLIVRVDKLVPEKVWRKRYEEINQFEKFLANNGTKIIKFYLHISKEEQKERFLARLNDPSKNWKFDPGDLAKRAQWEEYIEAFDDALGRCSSPLTPWYVIPANKKWYRDVLLSKILVETLESMDLHYPSLSFDPKTIPID